MLRKIAIGYTGTFLAFSTGILFYIKDIKPVSKKDYPIEFQRLIFSNNRHALFLSQIQTNSSIRDVTKILFTQPLYQLEYLVSDTTFPEPYQFEIGEKIGHLQLEYTTNNTATFRYVFPGIHFCFFVQVQPNSIAFGYVDYLDSDIQELGNRIYIPMLLKGLSNRINKLE
jgi:hypothetical protein